MTTRSNDGEEQSNLLELDVHDDHDHPDGQGGGLHGSHQESSIPGETGLYLSGGRFLFLLDLISVWGWKGAGSM